MLSPQLKFCWVMSCKQKRQFTSSHWTSDKKSTAIVCRSKCRSSLNPCYKNHYVKSVQIRSFFWSVFSCIQSEYRKIQSSKKFVFGHFLNNDGKDDNKLKIRKKLEGMVCHSGCVSSSVSAIISFLNLND